MLTGGSLGRPRCIVIGCGVIGLSTGIRLLEADCDVDIWARDTPPNTTSDVAAALWYPHGVTRDDDVVRWAESSFRAFRKLANIPATGVQMSSCTQVFECVVPDPWWRDVVHGFRRALPTELPAGYSDGYLFDAPLIETPRYMPYLVGRFEDGGGRISPRVVANLAEPFSVVDVVINCSGLGARCLVDDKKLHSDRGQVVLVAPTPGLRIIFDTENPRGLSYIIPRSDCCILGGTDQFDNEDLTPDPEVTAAIVRRCSYLDPRVAELPILGTKVGLRPSREKVRLDMERWELGKTLVHNYGHSGAGVSLSWGCADAVINHLRDAKVISGT